MNFKQLLAVLLLCSSTQFTWTQSIGVFGGVNSFQGISFHKVTPHWYLKYKGTIGYSIGVELDDLLIYNKPIKFSSRFNNYSGHISYESSGMGGGYNLEAELKNYSLSFAFHFIKNKPEKPLQLSLGLEYCLLLKEKIDGTSKTWSISQGLSTKAINESSIEITKKGSFGIIATAGIKKELGRNLCIEPQLSIIYGLLPELYLSDSPHILRILIEVGISRKKTEKIAVNSLQ